MPSLGIMKVIELVITGWPKSKSSSDCKSMLSAPAHALFPEQKSGMRHTHKPPILSAALLLEDQIPYLSSCFHTWSSARLKILVLGIPAPNQSVKLSQVIGVTCYLFTCFVSKHGVDKLTAQHPGLHHSVLIRITTEPMWLGH